MEALEEMVHYCICWTELTSRRRDCAYLCELARAALRVSHLTVLYTLMGYFFLYYALGLPTFLFTIIALYLLFTGTNHVPRSLHLTN